MSEMSMRAEPATRPNLRVSKRHMSLGMKCLVHLTTSRWRAPASVYSIVATLAQTMVAEGWILRGAWPRNYALWRNGRTTREAGLPFVVLPIAFGRLTAMQINVFLAVELTNARTRLKGQSDQGSPSSETEELEYILSSIHSASAGVDPYQLHRAVAAYLQGTENMPK